MKTKVEHKNSELVSIFKKGLGWHTARIKFSSPSESFGEDSDATELHFH